LNSVKPNSSIAFVPLYSYRAKKKEERRLRSLLTRSEEEEEEEEGVRDSGAGAIRDEEAELLSVSDDVDAWLYDACVSVSVSISVFQAPFFASSAQAGGRSRSLELCQISYSIF
jgi:hypothetical protein